MTDQDKNQVITLRIKLRNGAVSSASAIVQPAQPATPKRPTKHLRGPAHHLAKLSEANVREIRRQLASGERQAVIAKQFGVSVLTIRHILIGRTWAWLDAGLTEK